MASELREVLTVVIAPLLVISRVDWVQLSSVLAIPQVVPLFPPCSHVRSRLRMGAEVRIVNVWRVMCAQYPAVVL